MVLLTWVDYFLTYRVSMATVDFKKDFARLLLKKQFDVSHFLSFIRNQHINIHLSLGNGNRTK